MCRLKTIVVAAAILMTGIGCAHQPVKPYNPFKIDAWEFCNEVKTIALIPVRLPEGVLEPETVKAQFEAAIEEKLSEAGFRVLPSKAYRETEEGKARESGGYFDIKTGVLDEEKFKSIQDQTRKELRTTQSSDAFLHAAVRVVTASFYGGMVYWHGAVESISKTGKRAELNKRGTIGALSLGISIEDADGKDLYTKWGGIQLLSKIEDKGKILEKVKFIPVPEDEILSIKMRNAYAVEIALGNLLKEKKKHLRESAEPAKKEP